jgi:FecR protein
MNTLSELPIMFRKLFPLLAISLSGVAILPVSDQVNALTPLTRGQVQQLRNLVQLMPQNKPKRKAKLSDSIIPGDGLSTGRSSLADLRFNDGSLARVGEQAIFRFLPQTRNFTLNNGTVLLLIPPGRGRTNIKTPSAAAAIRGSALFVRYDSATDTTVVGALTNSGIEVTDKDGANSQVLKAGQMMVVVKGKFEKLYNFDLRSFYETSDIIRGLDLTRQSPTDASKNPTLDSVRAETSEALAKQPRITGVGMIQNPSFLKVSPPPAEPTTNIEVTRVDNQATVLSETSQVQSKINPRDRRIPDQNVSNSGNESTNTSNIPVIETKLPETKVPETKPVGQTPSEPKLPETKVPETKPVGQTPSEPKLPETKVPETKPVGQTPSEPKLPETKVPETKPPETKPPETKPPETKPPETKPPETKPPEVKPPETKPPETKPPETKPPEVKPPEVKPPSDALPPPGDRPPT